MEVRTHVFPMESYQYARKTQQQKNANLKIDSLSILRFSKTFKTNSYYQIWYTNIKHDNK